MPRLSAIAIRAALLYLLVGFTLGALLLANKGMPLAGWIWSLLPAHIEFLLVGWTAQLILGMAFWILPRYPAGWSKPAGDRGNVTLARLSIVALNLGVLTVAAQVIWPGQAGLLLVGRSLEVLAALLFAAHAWGRVRPSGPVKEGR